MCAHASACRGGGLMWGVKEGGWERETCVRHVVQRGRRHACNRCLWWRQSQWPLPSGCGIEGGNASVYFLKKFEFRNDGTRGDNICPFVHPHFFFKKIMIRFVCDTWCWKMEGASWTCVFEGVNPTSVFGVRNFAIKNVNVSK